MQFSLIDRIVALDRGRRIVAAKNLTLAEEYLADHFPGFPVLPGVLMVEAMTQAAAWLIRLTEDYAHSMIVLKGLKALKYGAFVTPGRQLLIEEEVTRQSENETELKAKGTVDGASAVAGRITVERYNLRDRDPALQKLDAEIVAGLKTRFLVIARDGLRN